MSLCARCRTKQRLSFDPSPEALFQWLRSTSLSSTAPPTLCRVCLCLQYSHYFPNALCLTAILEAVFKPLSHADILSLWYEYLHDIVRVRFSPCVLLRGAGGGVSLVGRDCLWTKRWVAGVAVGPPGEGGAAALLDIEATPLSFADFDSLGQLRVHMQLDVEPGVAETLRLGFGVSAEHQLDPASRCVRHWRSGKERAPDLWFYDVGGEWVGGLRSGC